MKDINDLIQESLSADRLKLEEEIEDLESDLSLFTVVLELLKLTDHNGNTFENLLCKSSYLVDDFSNIERKHDKLKEQLKAKLDEYKRICERLEEY